MPKTKEELNQLKKEYEVLTSKLKELTDEELKQVIGGIDFHTPDENQQYEHNLYNDDPNNPENQPWNKK